MTFAQLKNNVLQHYINNASDLAFGDKTVPERLITASRAVPAEGPFIKIIVEPARRTTTAGRVVVKAEVAVKIYCGVTGFTSLSEAEDAAMALASRAHIVAAKNIQLREFTAPIWDAHYSSYSVAYIEAKAFYNPSEEGA